MTQSKRIYAVTGGIGSGKTAVSDILKGEGYPVLSCDAIYAELTSGGELVKELEQNFGQVTAADGSLNRRALSERVFGDSAARKKLDSITHPIIMRRLLDSANNQQSDIVFCEVPLLFENGFEALFSGVIVVMRELSARIEAVKARSGLTTDEVMARIATQCDYSSIDLSNFYVVENDGNIGELKKKVKKILQNITKLT